MTNWKEATYEELENEGYRVGEQIAKVNDPDPCEKESETNRSEFKEAYMEKLNEAEENYRQFSPFEFFVFALNSREDADEAWEAYGEGISRAFSDAVDEYDDKPIPITEELGERIVIDMLNGDYEVKIAGRTFEAGVVLRMLDEEYFSQVVDDYIDSLGLEIV